MQSIYHISRSDDDDDIMMHLYTNKPTDRELRLCNVKWIIISNYIKVIKIDVSYQVRNEFGVHVSDSDKRTEAWSLILNDYNWVRDLLDSSVNNDYIGWCWT